MNNSGRLVLVLALVLGSGAWFLFGRANDDLDPDITGVVMENDDSAGGVQVADATSNKRQSNADGSMARSKLAGTADTDEDPFYTRALAGFRGRLVLTDGKPAADRAVRFFRIDLELMQNPYLFAEQPVMQPKLELYESRSAADGTFTVTGVWPQVFYLLVADVGGENQKPTLIEDTPGPGEVIDLGDIVLPDLGIITGRVVDMDGEPAAGALVRATDLPGALLDMVPVERFDPDGGLIVDEGGFQVIMTMPPWVRTAFDVLPIPTTRTNADGEFELRAVPPGMNSVIVNLRNHVALVRKGIVVKPGKTRKLGKLSLKEGEIAEGVVTDTSDEPIVGAEVMIANKAPGMPVHFATFADPTDEKGKFSLSGLRPGPIYAAVRRSKNEAWTLRGPVSVGADLEIKIPSNHVLTVRVKTEWGAVPEDVEFKLCNTSGENGPGLNLASIGMIPFLDVTKRVERVGTDKYRIPELLPGEYVLAVRAKGCAASKLNLVLAGDTEKEITLKLAMGVPVLVVDTEGIPIRNVKIYAEIRGENRSQRLQEIPLMAGKTDREGELLIEHCQKGVVTLSASHPAYGIYHKTITAPVQGAVVITMLPAGVVTGLLTDGGKPPKPGKWTVSIERAWQDSRGAMQSPPRLVVPDLEGRFHIHGLAPGNYHLEPIPSMGGIGSAGSIAKFAMLQSRHSGEVEKVHVPAGGEVHVRLDASGKRDVTGPSAMVTGTVMINGRPGTGMTLTGWSQGGRLFAEVDASGRFDMGRVEVGSFELRLRPKAGAEFDLGALNGQLWRQNATIKENEDQQLDITINTGSISGIVLRVDGAPVASVQVRANGTVKVLLDQPKKQSQARMEAITDVDGRFEFKQLTAGTYQLEVQGESGWGRSKGLAVQGGLSLNDVRIQLEKVFTIRGKVDLSVYPAKAKSDFMYIWFREEKNRGGNRGNRVNSTTGEFTVTGLPRGKYTAQISNWGNANKTYRTGHTTQPLMVDRDLTAITIRPTFPPK